MFFTIEIRRDNKNRTIHVKKFLKKIYIHIKLKNVKEKTVVIKSNFSKLYNKRKEKKRHVYLDIRI